MRNLAQYPITKDEIIQALNECLEDEEKAQANDRGYGDIKGLCIKEAIRIINESDAVVYLKPASMHFELNDGNFTRQKFIDMMEITGKFDLDESID